MGRTADPAILAAEGLPFVSASDVPIAGQPTPRPLTVEEMKEYIQMYATAASNAVYKAGFDGVEIHAANGCFLDQFLHDCSNIRTDAYGGSGENRTRLPLEVTEAMVKAVWQKKTGFRISPWGTYNDMYFGHPKPTYSHLVTQLCDRYHELAYLHVIESRVDGTETVDVVKDGYSNDFIRAIHLISAGGTRGRRPSPPPGRKATWSRSRDIVWQTRICHFASSMKSHSRSETARFTTYPEVSTRKGTQTIRLRLL